jgi:putative ABC transport system permease protein
MLQDLRYALRTLRHNPGFTAVVVLTLALGIGANTAIFSAVDAVLLRPLPYPRSERLVEVTSSVVEPIGFGVSYPDLLDLRGLTRDFSGVAAYSTQRYNLTGAGDPREVQAAFVTADLFDVLGVHPQIGASFTPAQEHDPIALLSNALWATSFGRDPSILGKSIALDGKTYTIVGVMPAGFHFPDDEIEVWTPVGGIAAHEPRALTDRGFHALNAVARIAPQATLAQVQGDLNALAKRIAAESADDELGLRAKLLRDAAIGDVGSRLWVLLGAVGLVLLIACANAANLLLARATSRRREMAIRRAMGAGRPRLVRQLLTESVLLAFAGAGLGLVLATWGLDALIAVWPRALPRSAEVGLDGRVLAFTAGLAVLTGIAFGLAPALRATSPQIEEALRDDAAGSGGGRRRHRVQNTLIVAEVALALVLLVGAGLLVRSFIALNRVNLGFDTRDVLAARIRLTPSRYAQEPAQREFFNTLLASLAARPDVASAGVTESLPLSGAIMIMAFDPHPIRPDYPNRYMVATMSIVTPDYFTTLRIPIRRGRGFTAEDRAGSPRVAVVSAQFANELWPGLDPIGRQLPARRPGSQGAQLRTIIGVVDDLRSTTLDDVGRDAVAHRQAARTGGSDS